MTRAWLMRGAVVTIAAIGTLPFVQAARAVPLDIETCDKLVQQEAELERLGVRNALAKGPQWAKQNLSSDQIELVRRLIEIEEQVAFRCLRTKPLPASSLVAQPPPPPPAPARPPAAVLTASFPPIAGTEFCI